MNDIGFAWHVEIKHERPGLCSLLTAAHEIRGDSMMSYLIYMAIRVMEMRRLLKPAGSMYLHFPEGRPDWANQTIWIGDNLDIMRGMNSASVDPIYLDPPFQLEDHHRSADRVESRWCRVQGHLGS